MKSTELINALIKVAPLMGLSRKELCALTGYNSEVVGSWITGKKRPTLDQYVDWANALGYDVLIKRKGFDVSDHTF